MEGLHAVLRSAGTAHGDHVYFARADDDRLQGVLAEEVDGVREGLKEELTEAAL